MKTINTPSVTNITRVVPFDSLSISKNEIILKNKNKEENSIEYAELDKIYINRCKLSFLNIMGILSLPFFLIVFCSPYLPIEVLFILGLFGFTALYLKVTKFRWHQLNVCQNDGTVYVKKFFKKTKQEHINLVNLVKNEMFHYRINKDNEDENISLTIEIEKNYDFPPLSIAT